MKTYLSKIQLKNEILPMAEKISVYLEIGPKHLRCIDWPGWSRSGSSASEALQSLLDYAKRYRCA
jgi:hypothetical protein